MFDLQNFADENNENEKTYGDILDGAEETVDDNSEIPAGLEGIPKDIANEVLQDSAEIEKTSENPAPTDNVTIPYARFKEVNDKKNESKRLLAVYRERYDKLNTQPQSSTPPQNFSQPQQQPPQFQPPSLDEIFTKQIDDEITQTAMNISGLSKEDVEALDYLDDDPKISHWNHVKRISETAVYNDIINRQMAQQQEFQRAATL